MAFFSIPLEDAPAAAAEEPPAGPIVPADLPNLARPQVYFQVLQSYTARQMVKTAPSAEKRANPGRPLMFLLQHFDARHGDGAGEIAVEVFADQDPTWTTWDEVGNFQFLRKDLTRWTDVSESLTESCYWLRGPVRAHSLVPLADAPCLILADALYSAGWKSREEEMRHALPSPAQLVFDGTEALKQRWYYLVMLRVPTVFEFCSVIPSNELISF